MKDEVSFVLGVQASRTDFGDDIVLGDKVLVDLLCMFSLPFCSSLEC
jgi:hypothetical protein